MVAKRPARTTTGTAHPHPQSAEDEGPARDYLVVHHDPSGATQVRDLGVAGTTSLLDAYEEAVIAHWGQPHYRIACLAATSRTQLQAQFGGYFVDGFDPVDDTDATPHQKTGRPCRKAGDDTSGETTRKNASGGKNAAGT